MDTNYGPLSGLIGTWEGAGGTDTSPEPEGTEISPYHETLCFIAAGEVVNAESQRLAVVRYHQTVSRNSNDEVFHDQVGYWTWDEHEKTIAHALAIPRRVTLLAGGEHNGEPEADGTLRLVVRATLGDPAWGILQSPFMQEKARTLSFEQQIHSSQDELVYRQITLLDIYGREFEHVDENRLKRCD